MEINLSKEALAYLENLVKRKGTSITEEIERIVRYYQKITTYRSRHKDRCEKYINRYAKDKYKRKKRLTKEIGKGNYSF